MGDIYGNFLQKKKFSESFSTLNIHDIDTYINWKVIIFRSCDIISNELFPTECVSVKQARNSIFIKEAARERKKKTFFLFMWNTKLPTKPNIFMSLNETKFVFMCVDRNGVGERNWDTRANFHLRKKEKKRVEKFCACCVENLC